MVSCLGNFLICKTRKKFRAGKKKVNNYYFNSVLQFLAQFPYLSQISDVNAID